MFKVGVRIFTSKGDLVGSGNFLYDKEKPLVAPEAGNVTIPDLKKDHYIVETILDGVDEKRNEFFLSGKTPSNIVIDALCGLIPQFVDAPEDFPA